MKKKLPVEDKSLLAEIALEYADIVHNNSSGDDLDKLEGELMSRDDNKVSYRQWHYLYMAYYFIKNTKQADICKNKAEQSLKAQAEQISLPEMQQSYIAYHHM